MGDVVLIATIVAFFAAASLLVRSCNGMIAYASNDELASAGAERDPPI